MSLSISKPCSIEQKEPAQTLFLGASVVSFNANMGWGGQPSQLTVNLIEDLNCHGDVFPNSRSYQDNHYHDCAGNNCYEDEKGNYPFDPDKNISPTANSPEKDKTIITPEKRLIPGKVYYKWDYAQGKFVSKYWKDPDPGFFGIRTKIGPNGEYNKAGDTTYSYDLINTPVFFKMGEFYFEGLVQSWEQDVGTGGKTYRVTIESVDTLLNQCWIITGDYAGSIFNMVDGVSKYGSPTNYAFGSLKTTGTIAQGNLPNVFNVYGFLESFGYNHFGGAKLNDNGMRCQDIIDGLSILTSSTSNGKSPDDNISGAHQFSPFGRIVFRTAQTLDADRTFVTSNISQYAMGIIPPTTDTNGIPRSFYVLDLSELPIPPDFYRISGSVISIMDFIRKVTEDLGYDFYFSMITGADNNEVVNVIKIRTIYRGIQPIPNQITNTINSLNSQGYNITSSTFGQEKNDSNVRTLYIGEKQHRLYQAKSYRLAYNQSNYIYNPGIATFVNYQQFDKGILGKIKIPSAYSTRNPSLSVAVNGSLTTELFNLDEDIKNEIYQDRFGNVDNDWRDTETSSAANESIKIGNYTKTVKVAQAGDIGGGRYYPLYRDVISPFFGYQLEDTITLSNNPQDNVFRYVRPVWMDLWTGQIVVVNGMGEIPRQLSRVLYSLYNDNHFKVSETEMRAAMMGAESYLMYCMGKTYKPDLFSMLLNAYKRDGITIFVSEADAEEGATNTATHYGVGTPNCAGPFGYPTISTPGVGDNLNVNLDFLINPLFMKDITFLAEFISAMGNKHYGKKYLVKIPDITSYKDDQYFDVNYTGSSDNVKVFKGSGKIFYNYEPTNDGAWEEYGNMIDDSILVGSVDWNLLSDDSGKIKPIIGYNATDSLDYIARAICTYTITNGSRFSTDLKGEYRLIKYNRAEIMAAYLNGTCADTKFLFPSLDVGSLDSDTYVVKSKPYKTTDAYSLPTAGNSKKLYGSTTIEEQIVYLNPKSLQEPRVIINGLDLKLNSTSLSYSQDPNRTILANIAIEDLAIYLKTLGGNTALRDNNYIQYMLNYVSPIFGSQFLVNSFTSNQSSQHAPLAPKVAHPFFAAIPMKSNQYRYGPWTNYPDLIKDEIFPGLNENGTTNAIENLIGGVKVEIKSEFNPWNYGGMSLLDQEVINEASSSVNYQQVLETAQVDMPGLPIFGLGAKFSSITNSFTPSSRNISFTDVKYAADAPSIPIVGNPVSIPNELLTPSIVSKPFNYTVYYLIAGDQGYNEPVITSIQVGMGSQISTSYNFRTYIRKLGFFNKETTDKLKQSALASIRTNKLLNSSGNQFLNLLNKQTQEIINRLDKNDPGSMSSLNSKLFATSPSEVLVSMAQPYISPPNLKNLQKYFAVIAALEKKIDKDNGRVLNDKLSARLRQLQAEAVSLQYGIDIGDGAAKNAKFADKDSTTDPNGVLALKDTLRFNTSVFMYPAKELPVELNNQYSQKSIMSLDGLLSPVSFYPSYSLSTYSLTKYDRLECPHCNGTGSINDTLYNYKVHPPTKKISAFACLYCVDKKMAISVSKTKKTSNSSESLPPYVVTAGTDISILLKKFNSGIGSSTVSSSSSTSAGNETVPINMYSLQPIVVPYGDFRNPNAQSNDRCRHSIKVIARGDTAPKQYRTFNIANNLTKYFNPQDGTLQKTNGTGVNADYYYRNIFENKNLTNQRFIGLRGPLIVHGWGYDTEGYPVPNAADEPAEYDTDGNPRRFLLKTTTENKKYKDLEIGDVFTLPKAPTDELKKVVYTKTASLLVRANDYTFDLPTDNLEVEKTKYENNLDAKGEFITGKFGDKLGDIIGKYQTWDPVAKKYKEKVKLPQFYLNWAERPDLWPVGPIDLRWDADRKVWSANQPSSIYKMVYITLEEDLIKEYDYDESYPTRGFLDDIEYSSEPLPNGFRRLVYVKDRAGFTAPRGAKLLCRYDQSTGFYEPVSKPSFICMGIISGTNATITMAYVQGKKKGEVPTMMVPYENPLQFTFNANNNTKGMFTYIGNKWTLSSVQQ